jgi:hypothetical protein
MLDHGETRPLLQVDTKTSDTLGLFADPVIAAVEEEWAQEMAVGVLPDCH